MKEEGLEAEIIRMSSTVAAVALATGEADYVTGTSAIRRAIQGLCRLKSLPPIHPV
jgi:hypothetical protein